MTTETLGSNAQGRLRSIVERIERLEEDKAAVMTDMKEVFAEAKGEGYDVKALREVVRIRKQDAAKRAQHQAIVDLYLHAVQGDLFEREDSGITMTMRVGDGPEIGPFTTGDLKRATEALS